jgi:hypothetical protein
MDGLTDRQLPIHMHAHPSCAEPFAVVTGGEDGGIRLLVCSGSGLLRSAALVGEHVAGSAVKSMAVVPADDDTGKDPQGMQMCSPAVVAHPWLCVSVLHRVAVVEGGGLCWSPLFLASRSDCLVALVCKYSFLLQAAVQCCPLDRHAASLRLAGRRPARRQAKGDRDERQDW